MDTLMTPDTSLALLQASQAQSALPSAASNFQAAKDARQLEQIETAAKEFEAVFMSEMLKPMFEGIEVNSEFGGGKGEEIFSGFMIQEYGKILAETGTIGIADQVKAELIERQGLNIKDIDLNKKKAEIAQQKANDGNTATAPQRAEDNAFNTLISTLTQ